MVKRPTSYAEGRRSLSWFSNRVPPFFFHTPKKTIHIHIHIHISRHDDDDNNNNFIGKNDVHEHKSIPEPYDVLAVFVWMGRKCPKSGRERKGKDLWMDG